MLRWAIRSKRCWIRYKWPEAKIRRWNRFRVDNYVFYELVERKIFIHTSTLGFGKGGFVIVDCWNHIFLIIYCNISSLRVSTNVFSSFNFIWFNFIRLSDSEFQTLSILLFFRAVSSPPLIETFTFYRPIAAPHCSPH